MDMDAREIVGILQAIGIVIKERGRFNVNLGAER